MRSQATFAAAVVGLFVTVAGGSKARGDQHTLGELFAGANLTAGGLTFSNWQLDLVPTPKFGSNNQDINQIVLEASSQGGPEVVLKWDASSVLHTEGREEINFILRYTVSAPSGYVALAKTKLTDSQIMFGAFPDTAPELLVEQFVSAAGTIFGGLVALDVGRTQTVDARILEPLSSVDVSTHIVLRGDQDDDNVNAYDTVRLDAMEQIFWRAARILTVNSTVDLPDGNIGDGIADTGNASAPTGVVTLRAALNEADGTPDLDFIKFNIPGATVPKIQPRSELFGGLGALWPVIVDADTQEAGWVELDGSNSPPASQGVPTVGFELVGQLSAVRGLVINRFDSHGLQIRQSGAPFKGNNLIVGNRIGTDATGTQNLGNKGDGIRIVDQPYNVIGGSELNQIVNNLGNGVAIVGTQSIANSVARNSIVGNRGHGVFISDGAGADEPSGGRPTPAAIFGNRIAASGAAGVRIEATAKDGNHITLNSIEANDSLGIDTGPPGPTPVAVPVLTKVISSAGMTYIDGSLQGTGTRRYDLEFFVSPAADPSGSGEGAKPFGARTLFTDSGGKDRRDDGSNPGFPFIFHHAVPAGHVLTATATARFGTTSEFSAAVGATANALPDAIAGQPRTVVVGTKVNLDGTQSNDPDKSPAPLTFAWEQTGGPAVALNNPTGVTPDFTPAEAAVYTFRLTVRDGLHSSDDAVSITVNAVPPNTGPNASAVATPGATVGKSVVLDGSTSTDPDNKPGPLSFSWTQIGGPVVALTAANTARASFTPGVAGTYMFSLSVSDGAASDVEHITFVVAGNSQQAVLDLINSVKALKLSPNAETKLVLKLNTAHSHLVRGSSGPARDQLLAFTRDVEALRKGQQLSAAAAADLTAKCNSIISSLGP